MGVCSDDMTLVYVFAIPPTVAARAWPISAGTATFGRAVGSAIGRFAAAVQPRPPAVVARSPRRCDLRGIQGSTWEPPSRAETRLCHPKEIPAARRPVWDAHVHSAGRHTKATSCSNASCSLILNALIESRNLKTAAATASRPCQAGATTNSNAHAAEPKHFDSRGHIQRCVLRDRTTFTPW